MGPNMDTATTDSAALQVHKRQEMFNTFGDVKFFIAGGSAERMMNFAHSCSVTKLLEYAGGYDATYIRMGTSGGIGVEPGTVVITSEGVNNKMESVDEVAVLGFTELRPSTCSPKVRDEIIIAAEEVGLLNAVSKTVSFGALNPRGFTGVRQEALCRMLLHYIKAKLSAV
ncbi:unnamed protein product [Peronospora destructor]|uniref:Nucleoside phosphorylase domain-containing protein n=1 Tax=Peronospora destructor TaxID=86335 RepID=A0AAV0TZK0_9STRA|nr:unnamed protein product [Peronospora destructor]